MKRLATLSLAIILTLSFSLGSAFAQDEDVTIGLVTINLQALFFNQINDGVLRKQRRKQVSTLTSLTVVTIRLDK